MRIDGWFFRPLRTLQFLRGAYGYCFGLFAMYQCFQRSSIDWSAVSRIAFLVNGQDDGCLFNAFFVDMLYHRVVNIGHFILNQYPNVMDRAIGLDDLK